MPGDFFDRLDELEAMIPDESVTAALEVDQVYAHYQHEGLDFEHPRGGEAKYLEQPWEQAGPDFGERMARGLLEPEGLQREATEFAESGAKMVEEHAPVLLENLRQSGHPTVQIDGEVTYDRPPIVPRLSEDELKALHRGVPGE